MARDSESDTDDLDKRLQSTSRALLLDQIEAENDYMIEHGYSDQQRFINIRPISLYYCQLYTPNQYKLFVPYLALSYHDRFLSRNFDIPVMMQGEGFERNLQLFVLSCVSIACKQYNPDFNLFQFTYPHHVLDERDVRKMEILINEGLEGKLTLQNTAINTKTLDHFISLLEMEDQQQSSLLYYFFHTLFTINEDIKFTEFRPSILMASVILVVSYKLYPYQYTRFRKKIFKSRYVQESKVQECFHELKDHVLVDRVFNHEKCPLPLKPNVRRELGKNLAIDEPCKPYKYLPNSKHPLEFGDDEISVDEEEEEGEDEEQEDRSEIIREDDENNEDRSEILKFVEGMENLFVITKAEEGWEFTSENIKEEESVSESESEEEEKYSLMQRVIICLFHIACIRCFGYEIRRRRSD